MRGAVGRQYSLSRRGEPERRRLWTHEFSPRSAGHEI